MICLYNGMEMRSYEKKDGTGEVGIKKKLNALGQTAS